MTTPKERWDKLSDKDKRLNRTLDFKQEIAERLEARRGRWARFQSTLDQIIQDEYVRKTIESTLAHESLIGIVKQRALDQIVERIRIVEEKPIMFDGGLPERNRSKH